MAAAHGGAANLTRRCSTKPAMPYKAYWALKIAI